MMPRPRLPVLAQAVLMLAALVAVGGCTALPVGQLPARQVVGAPPRLLPLEPMLATADAMAAPADPSASVAGSAAELRRRAAALRGM